MHSRTLVNVLLIGIQAALSELVPNTNLRRSWRAYRQQNEEAHIGNLLRASLLARGVSYKP